ncbi:hypothetical protein N7463_000342 [Penicillium fimorum]|uniref:Fungal N-terminal domain-containing protein n=1 Tax=Penicillium fimorum TaxID=1882269 RepID=A0A9W9Y489_9EURO|nr:hypothetical protein N7463_000342 [Penicillium fimorum]
MAEALGVASAGVGIASFAIQVVSRVHALETTYRYNKNKVSIDLESLSRRLKAMQLILYTLQPLEGNPLIDLAVGDCCLIYSKADLALESLIKDVQSAAAIEGNGLKSARRLLSRKAQRQVREIESELDSMHNCLTVYVLVPSKQVENTDLV